MDVIKFTINGKKYSVGSEVAPDTSLNDFIRLRAELRGTKAMCHEGGCGACIVAVSAAHPKTKEMYTFSVNSCLVSVLSCHGWDVITVEGIGGKRIGYHPIQERLASFNGSQCGFCSSGWVMSMYSLFESRKHKLTMKDIENSFGSNICRCTGYRPILDAFKSLAIDSPPQPHLRDIEDITICRKSGTICDNTCSDVDHDDGWCTLHLERDIFDTLKIQHDVLKIELVGHTWFKVFDLESIFRILDRNGYDSYMLIAGNTGQGVYPLAAYPRVLIDISSVDELRVLDLDVNLVLGAGVSLSDALAEFTRLASVEEDFSYLGELARHLDLVAHVPVRNIGTIGGNLALKHQHNEFPSDVFLLLETVGAVITLQERDNKLSELTMMEFLTTSLAGKVILNVKLPPLGEFCLLKTYKVMPRAQNAHAHVSAGILLQLEPSGHVQHAALVYAGIAPDFVHAEHAERVLVGRDPFHDDVLALALSTLSEELFPDYSPPDPSPLYRKKLAVALFYKAIISLCPPGRVAPHVKSGGETIHTRRALSHGQQSFESDRATWPLGRALPRLDALAQCSGEARYADDLPRLPHEFHAALVLASVATGTIDEIDATEALAIPGVVGVFTSRDIPGTNAFTRADLPLQGAAEEVLCSGQVLHHAQPLAVIVAETHKLAVKAALQVNVTYKDQTHPVLTVREALKTPESEMRRQETGTTEPKTRGTDVRRIVRGSYDIGGQYHYHMEPQSCVAEPHEDGWRLHSATQWMDGTQIVVAAMLGVPESSVDVTVRRIGGAFGAKLTRSAQVACAAALAASHLHAPVRLVLPVRTNMAAIGKRPPCSCDYEVGVNDDGEIQYLINTFYDDEGCSFNEDVSTFALDGFDNCYDVSRWKVSANIVRTDTPSNTWARAPGDCEGIAMIEHIMEHIAFEVKKDATEVRLSNMSKENNPMPELIDILKKDAEYDRRSSEVKEFNMKNRWIKRGIKIYPMQFPLPYYGNFSALVSIFHGDGTVGVAHGGIEMGQGVHTKVAQVCAHILEVPLESVSVKSSNTMTSPNDIFSGSSFVSELCAFAVMKCCEILLERLVPVRKKLNSPTWLDIIKTAYDDGINLQSNYMYSKNDDLKDYEIYGVTIAEVEVDILTGSHQILRVDILEDTGKSMNPELDIGQVEGAFMMGVGYWTSEQIVYSRGGTGVVAGALLTDRTWTYKPPGARDIPVDMRVYFKRNSYNATGVLGSKSAGEPPLCMAAVVPHAIRAALEATRADAGLPDTFFPIEYPYTTENIMLAAETSLDEMKLS